MTVSSITLTLSSFSFPSMSPECLCKHCLASFSVRSYFVHPSLKLSMAAWLNVYSNLVTIHSFRGIVIDNYVTESQVLSVFHYINFPNRIIFLRLSTLTSSKVPPEPMIRRKTAGMSTGATVILPTVPSAVSWISSCDIGLVYRISYFQEHSLDQHRLVLFSCGSTELDRETYTNSLSWSLREEGTDNGREETFFCP